MIDIGVFAYNEEASIAGIIRALAAQTPPFGDESARLHVLVNGSRDATATRARAAAAALPDGLSERVRVHDMPEPGKSRTWNRFVHELARSEAETLIFVDADITLIAPDTTARLVAELRENPRRRVVSSRPIKDIVHDARPLGLVGRLIAKAGGTLDDMDSAICGQLYAMRAEAARAVWMPAGLPVEDGFLRAMTLTDLLTRPEDLSRIGSDPAIGHVYESLTEIGPLLRHQTRIVIGGAVNKAVFDRMRAEAPDEEAARALLREAALDEGWLADTLRRRLPEAPHGYVPFHFLTKRLARLRAPRRAPVVLAGFFFDCLVWLRASLQMARGTGAGYW